MTVPQCENAFSLYKHSKLYTVRSLHLAHLLKLYRAFLYCCCFIITSSVHNTASRVFIFLKNPREQILFLSSSLSAPYSTSFVDYIHYPDSAHALTTSALPLLVSKLRSLSRSSAELISDLVHPAP